MLIALIGIPYINYQSNTAGVWFASVKGRHMALIAVSTAFIVTPAGILMDEYIVDLGGWMQAMPTPISNGLIPFALSLAGAFVFFGVIKNRYQANNTEAIQTVFILFLGSFLIFMVINIWFRGKGMALMWPWQVKITGV
jgi:hypothetical protein